jgi:hemerythrin-like domain-containing protein
MLTDFLTADHRRCDALFANAENAANDGDRNAARAAYAEFEAAMAQHLSIEESVLFPEFDARSGTVGGPTAVMRMEHEQMQAMMAQMRHALESGELDDFLGFAETLNILIQQHNMKEEQVLYPICDRVLADYAEALLERMRAH